MFDARPREPTMTTSAGFETSVLFYSSEAEVGNKDEGVHEPGVLKNRPIASMKMEKHRASKKTPLMRAARISARCHP